MKAWRGLLPWPGVAAPPANGSIVGTLLRVAFAGVIIAVAVGFPAFGVASATSQALTFMTVLKAVGIAGFGVAAMVATTAYSLSVALGL